MFLLSRFWVALVVQFLKEVFMYRFLSLLFTALSLVVFSAEARDPNLSKIEFYLERNGTHQKVENNSQISLDPVTVVDVEIRGFDQFGRQLQNFEYNPEVLLIGSDPNQYQDAYLEKISETGRHYRLHVEADLNARFFVRIFDRNNRSVRTQFSVLAKYTLAQIKMYLEEEGYHRYLTDGETLRMEPYGSLEFEVRGFDETGNQLNTFSFDPLVVISDDSPDHDCFTLERVTSLPGLHYRIRADGHSYSKVAVIIHDHSRHDLEKRFYVKLSYMLQRIEMYLEDQGYHRYLSNGETVPMEPDGMLTFEVRGFDETGRQLDKYSFDPEVTVTGGDHSYVRLEKLGGTGLHYRLIADGDEHDRYEVVVHDHSRHDLEKRFYVVSRFPVRPVSRLEMYRDGTEPLRYGATVYLEEGASFLFTIRGFDDRGRQLRKDQFAPVVELRNYSGSPRDAYLEIQSGNEYAYRLYFLHETPERGPLQIAVWDRDGRLQPQSIYVTTRMPEPPQNPQIKITQSDNDPAITSIRFKGLLEDFAGDVTAHVEATHPSARPVVYPVKVQNGQFLTDRINLPSGGITTIKLIFRNRLGDQISSEGYARNGIRGFEGFKSTTYERGR